MGKCVNWAARQAPRKMSLEQITADTFDLWSQVNVALAGSAREITPVEAAAWADHVSGQFMEARTKVLLNTGV